VKYRFRFLSIIIIIVFIISQTVITNAGERTFPLLKILMQLHKASSQINQPVKTAEPNQDAFESALEKTYAQKMIFKGENENWSVQYVVRNIIKETIDQPKPKITIIPKNFKYAKNVSYDITAKNGSISGRVLLSPEDTIELESYSLIPYPDENVDITLTHDSITESITLTNAFPSSIISANEALKNVFTYYKNINGVYPTSDFTFNLELMDDTHWLISYDDNDGIGGLTYITENALTGIIDDSKTDE
jgi:hypothetical protein